MGSDFVGGMGQEFAAGNNFTVAISPDSREDADRLFAGLSHHRAKLIFVNDGLADD